MKYTATQLQAHAEKAYEFYMTELGAPEGAVWIINPRDYHFLKSVFDNNKRDVSPMPQLRGIDAVCAHVWRRPPMIAMNIDAIEFLSEEPENEQ